MPAQDREPSSTNGVDFSDEAPIDASLTGSGSSTALKTSEQRSWSRRGASSALRLILRLRKEGV
jgi:hypothetical protein